ncbi:MAG: glycosyltransferase family 4 protein [Hyphomicrobiaceae bacterium]|nr:glycosyltransferase family 4 protein [Hyphomicrobiaceae bacterium]
MADVAFAIPGELTTPTGGYAYDREVMARLPGIGVPVRHVPLPAGYPSPSYGELAETARTFAALSPETVLLVDGLAFGAMPADLLAGVRQPIVALVHHPLGYEPGLPEARVRELIALERQALTFARRVVVTSPFTRRLLVSDFGVPEAAITVAVPGTEPAARAHGTGQPLQLLSVGSITPRKGFAVLVEALAPLASLDWRLTIAGPLDRDEGTVAALSTAISSHRLGARIELPGALDRQQLGRLYAAADVFVLPSLFEGFGMVLTEAMARGLPIVCTTGGAAAETAPDAAALKVAPGAVEPLSDALRQMIADADLRRRLSGASWQAGQHLPGWEETAKAIAAAIREVAE